MLGLLCLSSLWLAIPALIAAGLALWFWGRSRAASRALEERGQELLRAGDAAVKKATADLQEQWTQRRAAADRAPELLASVSSSLARAADGDVVAPASSR